MRDAKPLRLQRRDRGVTLRLPVLFQLLGFLLACVARGQQSPLPLFPRAAARPGTVGRREAAQQPDNNVAETISDNFSFRVASPLSNQMNLEVAVQAAAAFLNKTVESAHAYLSVGPIFNDYSSVGYYS
ncbi:uncharacterized protein LOC120643725 [Panicum virgatum]|uniref:Uncharacterized protein n=1 Tax=Panicum virgatum TaxID=38727 RepID=A0A8T0PMX4_PANVG|nr:uncharacterized protein LOC120643725 [Panicum virgatum]KAG2560426.1 hypothetical protein PVAP13_8KG056184 [Panicum virgatum]